MTISGGADPSQQPRDRLPGDDTPVARAGHRLHPAQSARRPELTSPPHGSDPTDPCAALTRVGEETIADFYAHLFANQPWLRSMFSPAMDTQRSRFHAALTRILASRHDLDAISGYLHRLGRAHRKFGVEKEHYELFGHCLAATLRAALPPAAADDTMTAWGHLYERVCATMIEAARQDAEQAPPWWLAEVTAHEQRGPDLAVLTLRPEQSIRYQPGQHISVLTPHRPRLWRDYSIANAPRPDGTLCLHVRAVAGGMVSTALVHRVTVGDTLLVAAPEGDMVADTDGDRDALCLAGGTGLAPIKAIIEAIMATRGTGRRREITVYYGARRRNGLYDLPALREMAATYPWLQVIPVVSDEPAPAPADAGDAAVADVRRGTIPDMVARAPWADRDVYVSGPDPMIDATVRKLRQVGVPDELIHYDSHLV